MQLFLSPDFNIKTLRRKPRTTVEKIRDQQQQLLDHQLTGVSHLLSRYIPQSLFDKHDNTKTRRRLFSRENTFWGFFLQTLQADSSCQSIVHQFRCAAEKNKKMKVISSSTSAYCQARKRFPLELLEDILNHTQHQGSQVHPLVNRRVVCADGTGLLAADTPDNQSRWPQPSSQKLGVGFPQLRLCGLFNLHSGVALSHHIGNKHSHELPLLREQESHFHSGDIFVGDKGFICYYDQARLLEQGVDSIVALARRKPVSAQNADRIIAADDLLITLPKFTSSAARSRYPKDRWEALPDTLQMRQIKVNITVPGYRSKSVYLLTTLLDDTRYPASMIAELYRQRWRVELFFRDLKTTLGMDFLQGKSPDMVIKETQMFFIVYNIIRLLIKDSRGKESPTSYSFQSYIQTLLAHSYNYSSKAKSVWDDLRNHLKKCTLQHRPDRVDPRVVKRRPKPLKLMVKPRATLKAEMLAKHT